jgi:uncharacterized protein
MDSHYAIEHQARQADGRYVIKVEDHEAELTYSRTGDGRMVIAHTYVPTALRERRLGVALVARAVQDARSQGLKIVPICWFARAEITRRAEWHDVLADETSRPT